MQSPRIGKVSLGRKTRIAGAVSTAAALKRIPSLKDRPFDIVELRLDLLGADTPDWMALCGAIEKAGIPVLLTIRSAREGGKWRAPDAQRRRLYQKALPVVSAVDVEIHSTIFKSVCRAAHEKGRTVIGSFHDFKRTPSERVLNGVIRASSAHGADVVKIATYARCEEDVLGLASLLRRHRNVPLSLLGMGPLGKSSRIELARAGSCLTYGFVDKPTAPGQYSCAELRARLDDT